MSTLPLRTRLAAGCLAALIAGPAAAQNPYSYVKMSLQVPWALYFVFLALVTVPFALMILLAWRRGRGEDQAQRVAQQASPGPPSAPAGNERPT